MIKVEAKKKYIILNSRKYGSYPNTVSEKCLSDLEKEHRSLRVNRSLLKSASGKGSFVSRSNNIGYIYDIKNAITAGTGRYLEYLIQYAGSATFTGIVFQLTESATRKVIYEIFIYTGKVKSNRIKIYIPFDSDIDISKIKFSITRLLDDKECQDEIIKSNEMGMNSNGTIHSNISNWMDDH